MVTAQLHQIALDPYQSRYNLPYSQLLVLQDTTQSRTQGSYLVVSNLGNQIKLNHELRVPQQYTSQYQSGYDSICILRYLFLKIQLNLELKVPLSLSLT